MWPLLDHRVGDIGVPFQTPESKARQQIILESGERFAGPDRIVQLIECNDRALWHSREKCAKCGASRLVKVAIDEQQAHNNVWMGFNKCRCGLRDVAGDELHFWQMSKKPIAI